MNNSNDSDESNNSGLYLLFVALLLIMVGVAYVRLPAFRGLVNTKAPWFKEKVGHYLVSAKPGDPQNPESPESPESPKGSEGDSTNPTAATAPRGFDLATFAARPESWPKTITIKKPIEFPAVLNGKSVGTIVAPAGSAVHLLKVENGKLGVEFQGGGKWLAPEATDLVERVQPGVASHP
jgi:hypothetical protein